MTKWDMIKNPYIVSFFYEWGFGAIHNKELNQIMQIKNQTTQLKQKAWLRRQKLSA